jgi:hypothetical protein
MQELVLRHFSSCKAKDHKVENRKASRAVKCVIDHCKERSGFTSTFNFIRKLMDACGDESGGLGYKR